MEQKEINTLPVLHVNPFFHKNPVRMRLSLHDWEEMNI
jgi:hypothetical protein